MKLALRSIALLNVAFVVSGHAVDTVQDPSEYVNILSGTWSRVDSSSGSLLPFVGRPWGMNNWAIQTNNYAGAKASPLSHWWFHPEDRDLYGIRCTHQASPWIYDYGEFLLTPEVGPLSGSWPDKASSYNRSSAVFRPYEINVTLEAYCTHNENHGGCASAAITATERAAILKLKFPPFDASSGWNQTRHLRLLVGRDLAAFTDKVIVDRAAGVLTGYTRANSGGVRSAYVKLAEDELKIAGSHKFSAPHCEPSGMLQSLGLRFTGGDLLNFSIPDGEDPALACAEACCQNDRCNAFSVDLQVGGEEGNRCYLKTQAVHDRGEGKVQITGWKPGHSPSVRQPLFAHYFQMEFDARLSASSVSRISDNMYNFGLEAIVSFDAFIEEVSVRIGTSFISAQQAKRNLDTEVPAGTSYEDLRAASRKAWNDLLGKSELQDPGNTTEHEGRTALQTWYTNLYRSSIYPRMLFEYDGKGNPIHFAPQDDWGRTFPGVLSSDSGFWDAYRTVYPLNSVIRADQMSIQMQGWLSAYKEGGFLPSWPSPGERGAMTGQMQDASVADAIAKNIPGIDTELAYKAILEDAFVPGRRKGLQEYIDHGFIPMGHDIGDEVAASLNYALADYCIGLAAEHLGDKANASVLFERSRKAWRSLWNAEYKGGFFMPRWANGSWDRPFDEFAWQGRGKSGQYTEASPWQYRFYVPHEPVALSEAYRAAPGSKTMCDYLEDTMAGARGENAPGQMYHKGQWGLHHEQVEMVEKCFGQYEHNNQPVWHQLYLFAAAGCASRGQYWLRQAMTRLYSPTHYSGDEDNGSMASWFLLSAMGIYQLVPGSMNYSIGSPLYRKLVMHLDNGRTLTILAEGNSPQTPYVHAVHFNGTALPSLVVDYRRLRLGGVLSFTMRSTPCYEFPCREVGPNFVHASAPPPIVA